MLDIFRDNAFSVISLTDAINNLDFVPGLIGSLGLFDEQGISTTAAAIEERDGVLELISPTPRGGPGKTLPKGPRTLRAVAVPHFEIDDSVMADEVQGVRAWGSETQVETVMGKVAERLAIHTNSMEATHEYSRIGAIKGLITYADGSTFDLFTQFGVTQEAEIDFNLDSTTVTGDLRQKCSQVVRQIAGILGAVPFSGIRAFTGDAFFDALIAHPEVRATYLGWTAAAELRQGYLSAGLSYGAFPFGGILWENYRGAVGGTSFIETTKAHLFPVGVPNLFRTYYAPADYIETVNTNGQRMYSKQYEMPNGKGIALESQMNALDICTRPRVLLKGTI